jgi:hypothetical protein
MPTQHNIIFVNGALIQPEELTILKDTFINNIKEFRPET